MKQLLTTILGIICLFLAPLHAQELPFQSGEKITYSVYYNVIGIYVNAGSATFTTYRKNFQNHDVYHVVGEGITNERYDWIFKVRDRYESYFDAGDLKPVKFIRNVHEGDYKKYEEVTFDHRAHTAVSKQGTVKLPHQVQDVISSLYYARNLDFHKFKVGDKVPFNMYLDGEVHNMYIRYMGREKIKTRYGTFRAIKLKPLVLKGEIFDGGEDMTIWVTDDLNHIPVRIETPITVGSIKVDMMHYKNLKYPLAALVAVK